LKPNLGARVCGSLSTEAASVSKIPIAGDAYDVTSGPALRVTRDVKQSIDSYRPLVLCNVARNKEGVSFDIATAGPEYFVLNGLGHPENL
jgi:hypothetical protein